MERLIDRRWLRIAILFAIAYPVLGLLLAALANPASHSMRVAWRLIAWLACAAVFAAHVGYEHFRLGSSPPRAALHVATAVALGAFALAVWVNVQPHEAAPSHPSPLAPWALIVFPAVTGAPAFGVALGAAALLARNPRRRP